MSLKCTDLLTKLCSGARLKEHSWLPNSTTGPKRIKSTDRFYEFRNLNKPYWWCHLSPWKGVKQVLKTFLRLIFSYETLCTKVSFKLILALKLEYQKLVLTSNSLFLYSQDSKEDFCNAEREETKCLIIKLRIA